MMLQSMGIKELKERRRPRSIVSTVKNVNRASTCSGRVECFPVERFLDKEGVATMEETSKKSAIRMFDRKLKTSLKTPRGKL